MLVSFATKTLVRERPERVADGHGGYEDDWSDPDELTLENCSMQPGASAEDLVNREGVRIDWTVFVGGHPDVRFGDRVKDGHTPYAVVGEPEKWPLLEHTKILLSRWAG